MSAFISISKVSWCCNQDELLRNFLEFVGKFWPNYCSTLGFTEIKCMELFPMLKALYFEGNGLSSLLGLENNPELRCLYAHENCVTKMEGLQNSRLLVNLNLSDNLLSSIEGLENCESLDCLYLARNRIGRNGLDDLRGLLQCPSITTLDL